MKIILLSLFLFSSISLGNETSKYIQTQHSINYLKLDEWIDFVKRIKNDEPIPPYFVYKNLDETNKLILLRYNLANFEEGLKKQLNNTFTELEISEANQILRNPFIIKLNTDIEFNYAGFSEINKFQPDKNLEGNRLTLLKSIANILGIKTIFNHEFNKYDLKLKERIKLEKILETSDSINNLEPFYKLSKKDFMLSGYHNLNFYLKRYKNGELREFIRILNGKKSIQKLLQAVNLYNYFYMEELKEKLKNEALKQKSLGTNQVSDIK